MDTETLNFPPGVYRIAVANSVEPQFMTNQKDYVTILPPGVGPEIEQEWLVRTAENGNLIIERPARLFPPYHLSYKGAPKTPEAGNRVETLPVLPLTEWRYSPAGPRNFFTLRVARSELGIRIAPPHIYPPFLELAEERLLEWRFEHVRPFENE